MRILREQHSLHGTGGCFLFVGEVKTYCVDLLVQGGGD